MSKNKMKAAELLEMQMATAMSLSQPQPQHAQPQGQGQGQGAAAAAETQEKRLTQVELDALFQTLLDAQNGVRRATPYITALREIKGGRKRSHWIWYVWPAHKKIRGGTSRKQYLLPDFETFQIYLAHKVLAARLIEITKVATERLETGVTARTLFGSATDSEKFTECMTSFALASCLQGSRRHVALFTRALRAALAVPDAALHPRVMEVFAAEVSQYPGTASDAGILGAVHRISTAATVDELQDELRKQGAGT